MRLASVVIAILALGSQACSNLQESSNPHIDERLRELEAGLRLNLEKVSCPVFIDLADWREVKAPSGTCKSTRESLHRFALLMGKVAMPVRDMYCLKRNESLGAASSDRTAEIFSWLSQLDEAAIANLVRGPIEFNQLPAAGQAVLARAVRTNSGIQAQILAGEPVEFRLHGAVRIVYSDDEGKSRSRTIVPEESIRSKTLLEKAPHVETPLAEVSEGSLDFGDGKLLTFGEFVRLGGQALNVSVQVDNRLSEHYVFAKGKFNDERFVALLRDYHVLSPLLYAANHSLNVIDAYDEWQRATLRKLSKALESGSADSSVADVFLALQNDGSREMTLTQVKGLFSDDADFPNLPIGDRPVKLLPAVLLEVTANGVTTSASGQSVTANSARLVLYRW